VPALSASSLLKFRLQVPQILHPKNETYGKVVYQNVDLKALPHVTAELWKSMGCRTGLGVLFFSLGHTSGPLQFCNTILFPCHLLENL